MLKLKKHLLANICRDVWQKSPESGFGDVYK